MTVCVHVCNRAHLALEFPEPFSRVGLLVRDALQDVALLLEPGGCEWVGGWVGESFTVGEDPASWGMESET